MTWRTSKVSFIYLSEKWEKVALSITESKITTVIYYYIELICIWLKELDLPVTKHQYDKYDLVCDFKKVYYISAFFNATEKMNEVVKCYQQPVIRFNIILHILLFHLLDWLE